MFDKYNELFNIYLKICKEKYNVEKPYDNLEDCCTTCERFRLELTGMLTLLEHAGKITHEQVDIEHQRIIKTFSTHDLFNAYMEKGEVMVWCKGQYTE